MAILTIIVLTIGSLGLLYITDNLGIDDSDDESDNHQNGDINDTIPPVVIVSKLNLTQTHIFKGENIGATLQVTVDNNITLKGVYISIKDNTDDRAGKQFIAMNERLLPGNSQFNLSLSPSFPYDGFVVIRERTYTIMGHELLYKYNNSFHLHSEDNNISLVGELYSRVNQMEGKNWTIQSTGNLTYSQDSDDFTIEGSNGSLIFQTTVQTTGYTSVNILTNSENSPFVGNVSYSIGSVSDYFLYDQGFPDPWTHTNNIPIGNLQDEQNLTIMVELHENFTDYTQFSMNFTSFTQKIPLYAVIASNNWQGMGEDGLVFQSEEFYIHQVGDRFERTFNLTIIPVAKVDFEFKNSTDLFEIVETAQSAVGQNLSLTNNEWTSSTGVAGENFGADILLVFTNRTMDHLGAVIGNPQPLNMGIHARGTLFTANLRLHPSFADNLLQHEISHIFGAPDRWTDTSAYSVMTKSKPDDAVLDLLTENFWLYLTNWLEVDIQTMAQYIQIYANT